MLFRILSVGKAPWVELDKLLDKTIVQGLSASRGLSVVLHWQQQGVLARIADGDIVCALVGIVMVMWTVL